jgi:predicted DNA-binding transcriptional regulator AlpA
MPASKNDYRAITVQSLDRLINEPLVRAAAGVKSRSTLRSMVEKGLFPRPIRVSPGRIAWSEAEIAAWQKERMEEREVCGSAFADRTRPAAKLPR